MGIGASSPVTGRADALARAKREAQRKAGVEQQKKDGTYKYSDAEKAAAARLAEMYPSAKSDQTGTYTGDAPGAYGAPVTKRSAAKTIRARAVSAGYATGTPDSASGRSADLGLAPNVTDEAYKMNPELLGQSARGRVQADAGSVAAQQRAMDELFGIYGQGGATAQDRAREGQARANSDQYIRSQREAHQQDLGERGMYGSGAEIGMLLGDRQNAATTMAQSDLATQAMHEQRAMDALMQGGDLAGRARDTSFQEGSARALGQDEFAVLRNNTVNQAKAGDADWLRQSKANLEKQKYDAWQRGLDRNANAAGGVMGVDSSENTRGYDWGRGVATIDAGSHNAANAEFIGDTVAGRGVAGNNLGVNTGTTIGKFGADSDYLGGLEKSTKGYGELGDGIVGGAAGGSSGSALGFGGMMPGRSSGSAFEFGGMMPGQSDDDDEKKRP